MTVPSSDDEPPRPSTSGPKSRFKFVAAFRNNPVFPVVICIIIIFFIHFRTPRFALSSLKSSDDDVDDDDDDDDTADEEVKRKSEARRCHRPYSLEEDKLIINYIIEAGRFEEVRGKVLWVYISEKVLKGKLIIYQC